MACFALEARVFDKKNVMCLDARNRIRFELAGDGTLLDDLGTSTGARSVELYNGRAEIRLLINGGKSAVSVSCAGVPTAFLDVSQTIESVPPARTTCSTVRFQPLNHVGQGLVRLIDS